jgi:multisubunit Na+/H+ antiporter MnhE subunit
MSRLILTLIGLTLVYALTLASFRPWDLAIGLVISGGIVLLFHRFMFAPDRRYEAPSDQHPPLWSRLLWFTPMVLMASWEICKGTWNVALIVLHVRPLRRPGLVQIPFGERTPTGVAVTSLVDTLSPGSFLIDIDWDERTMLFHVIDASDPDAVRASYQHFYDRWQRRVFP